MALNPPPAEQFRQALTFQRRAAATNVGGVVQGDWEKIHACRAAVIPVTGGEDIIAGRMAGQARYSIWIRTCLDAKTIDAACRAVDDRTGQVYNLGMPIDPEQAGRHLLIDAKAGKP